MPLSIPARRQLTRSRTVAALGVVSALAITACRDQPSVERLSGPTATRSLNVSGDSSEVGETPRRVPDHYIVIFNSTVTDGPGLAKALVAAHGGEIRFTYSKAVHGFAAQLPAAAVEALAHNPNIERIEPDGVIQTQGEQSPVPSWGLDRIDQSNRRLDRKYDFLASGAGVNAYIIDTGIRTTHVDFRGRAFEAFSVVDDGLGAQDCYGHGTHVAGTIGGTLYGVAKDARLYSVRVLPCSGSGEMSALIAGIDWVANNRVLPAVVNISLEGEYSDAANQAITNLVASGVTVVTSAGNDGVDACTHSPGSAAAGLTVGATDNVDNQPLWSNYGSCVDLHAPGVGIQSDFIWSDTAWTILTGTSMAAPHVAGAAALYLSTNPTATPDQVAAALLGAATRGVITSLGAGSPNLLLYTGTIGASTTAPAPAPTPTVDNAPTASFSVNCSKNPCRFDASGSKDDKGIVSYTWNFGNGSALLTTTSAVTTYTYPASGTYVAVLTVTDTKGQTGKASLTVRPKKP